MDIAIIGLGCRFPQARDPLGYWQILKAGIVTFAPVPKSRWNHAAFYDPSMRAIDKAYIEKGAFLDDGEVEEFAALHFGIAPRRIQVTDPQHRLLLDVVRCSLQDAGYERRPWDRSRTGVFVGASTSEYKDLMLARIRANMIFDGHFGRRAEGAQAQKLQEALVQDLVPVRAFHIAGSLLNMAAAMVAQQWDLGGPAYAIDAACSSALVAAHDAVVHLRAGQIDLAIASGVYLNLLPDNLIGFSRIGAISRAGECRPFDSKADGFVMGEGVGAVILKRLDDALRDGDRIYAVVRGSGCNNDGRSEGPMTPRQGGQLAALRMAYADAKVSPTTLGYIEAHGTATTVGDVVEVGALRTLYQEHGWKGGARTALGSVKANIGHTMSAAGIAGLIKATLALHHRTLPPQPGVLEENPKLELASGPFFVPREARPWESNGQPRRAGISAFGFGGTNAHVVLEEAPPRKSRKSKVESRKPRSDLFMIAASSAGLVARHARQIAALTGVEIADAAFTLSQRAHGDARLAVVADSWGQLRQRLLAAAEALERSTTTTTATPTQLCPGAVFAQGPFLPEARRLALLFPGQGAQRVGLLAEAYEQIPAFRAALDELDAALGPELHTAIGGTLRSFLYARPTEEAQRRLTESHVCQPAMAAVGLALHALLAKMNVKADAVLGHSLGEFAAAAAAGVISAADCVRLVARRGLSMMALRLEDRGAMVAAAAPRAAVGALPPGAVVANVNHPGQTVISGTSADVKAAAEALRARGIETTPLDVSHAFHSPLMAGVAAAMERIVASQPLAAPAVPLASAIDVGLYPGDAEKIRALWVRHATAPVDFLGALQCAAAPPPAGAGARVWLHVGAGTTLSGFAKGSLPERDRLATAGLCSRDDDGLAALGAAVGLLWTVGVPVDTAPLYEGREARLALLPPTPLATQPYWAVEKKAAEPFRLEAAMASDDLVALFREQVALLNQQAKVLEQQAAALAGRGLPASPAATPTTTATATPTATTTAPPTASAIPTADLAKQIIGFVSRISAFPPEAVKPSQTLVGDLGFDSLMTVELDGEINKSFPGAGGVPSSLLSAETTVQQLVDHVAQALAAPASTPPVASLGSALGSFAQTGPDLLRFAPVAVEVPVAAGQAPLPQSLFITRDPLGVADHLAGALRELGHQVDIGDPPAEHAGGIIHLAGLVAGPTPRQGLEGIEPLLQAHRLARLPTQLFAIGTLQGGQLGLGAGGTILGAALAGFAKALARERGGDLIKAIDLDGADGHEAMALAILAELRSGNAVAEVGWRRGTRYEADLVPAPAGEPIALGADDVVLVTGGARGVGARLADSLRRAGCRVITAGRSAPADLEWDVCKPLERALPEVTAIVHAAGVSEDGPAGAKDEASVLRVLGPKLAGLANALAAAPNAKVAILVSSWAGRFGNAGQTDYSAANAALSIAARLLPMRAVALAWPPWEGTGMVAKIPPLAKQALVAQGVPFIDGEAGERAFTAALQAGATGEVLLAHSRPARRTAHRLQIDVSRKEHVYLEDHQLAGQPVLPLASALDMVAAAALDATGVAEAPLVVRDFQLKAPVRVVEAVRIAAVASGEARPQAELSVSLTAARARAPSYVAFATVGADVGPTLASAQPAPQPSQEPVLPLTLEEFYAGFTFHGPRLQGILAIEQIGPAGIVGWVKTSRPADWIRSPRRASWAVDPLAVDAAMQLAAYWAWVTLERAGFPVGIDEYVQREPFGDGPVRATLTLEQSKGDSVRGTIVFQARDGRVLAIARGVEGEFKHRDPRFLRARGMAAVESQKSKVENERTAAAPVPEIRRPTLESPKPAIDEASYRIEQFPEVQELEQRLGLAAAFGLKNPYFNVHERVTNDTSVIGGRTMINWSSYNYLGLSGDPDVTRAAQQAVERYGTSVSASRVASGEKPLHRQLEAELAAFLGCEDSIVMVSGHGAFVTTIGHMVGQNDLILHDSLAHDCIMGGARLSGAKRRPFPHSDWQALEKQLAQLRPHYRRVLIAVEGVYSMDGDITPLPKFIELKKRYGALLLVDEAHSIGVLGETGRGAGEHFGVDRKDVDFWMGTFSKSFASCGGYVAGSQALVRYLKYTAPGFVYSVGMSPANAAAALEALRQIQLHPEKVRRLHERARLFLRLAKERGIDTGMSEGSAVVPAIIGNSLHSLQLSEQLRQRDINVQPIMYPAVEEDAARLRFFVTATHSEQQIRESLQVLAEELARVRAQGELQTGSI